MEQIYTNIQTKETLDMKTILELKDNAMLKVKPELFESWDFKKNDEIGLDIYKVTKGMVKDAWWICPKCESSHISKIYSKISGNKCPYCRGFLVNHTNCLANVRPDLLEIWCESNTVSPFEVTVGVADKVWWKCSSCEESYPMSINKKASGRGCSICSGYYVTSRSSFGGKFPELAKDWYPTKNGKLTPYSVSYGSGVKAWWKCPNCQSDYQMTIDKKTAKDANHSSCVICSNGLSFGERVIFELLRAKDIYFNREKTFKWSHNKRYDFYLPITKTIIEVHGEQHFNGSFSRAGGRSLEEEQENDIYKEKMAKENGIEHYIVIRSIGYDLDILKEEIDNSILLKLVGIQEFNIENIRKFSMNNLMSETWELYNSGQTAKEIVETIPLHIKTIKKYIKLGIQLQQCA